MLCVGCCSRFVDRCLVSLGCSSLCVDRCCRLLRVSCLLFIIDSVACCCGVVFSSLFGICKLVFGVSCLMHVAVVVNCSSFAVSS